MARRSYRTVTINDYIKVSMRSLNRAIDALLSSTKGKTNKGTTVVRDGFGKDNHFTFELHRKGQNDAVLAYEVYNGESYQGLVDIVSVPCYFGGVRYFFVCPMTGERCYSLRLFRGVLVSKKYLDRAYRGGKTMPYYCQTLSGRDRDRQALEVAESRAKRKGVTDEDGYWVKPPKMHYDTFNRLMDRISEAEQKQLVGFAWSLKGWREKLLSKL